VCHLGEPGGLAELQACQDQLREAEAERHSARQTTDRLAATLENERRRSAQLEKRVLEIGHELAERDAALQRSSDEVSALRQQLEQARADLDVSFDDVEQLDTLA
jgi:chromosome segregation ATPase